MAKKDKSRKPDYDEKEIPKVLKGPVEAPAEDKPESIVDIGAQPLRARPDYMEDPVGPQAMMMKDIPMKDLGEGKPPVLKDYDEPEGCPCQDLPQGESGEVSEEVVMPGDGDQGMLTVLICPSCNNEGPFKMTPPPGISMEARTLKCAKCHTKIPFKGIVKTASGKYVVARVYQEGIRKNLIEYLKSVIGEKFTNDVEIKINKFIDTIERELCAKTASSGSISSLTDRIRGIVKQGTIITWDLAQDVGVTLDQICKLSNGSKKDKDKD